MRNLWSLFSATPLTRRWSENKRTSSISVRQMTRNSFKVAPSTKGADSCQAYWNTMKIQKHQRWLICKRWWIAEEITKVRILEISRLFIDQLTFQQVGLRSKYLLESVERRVGLINAAHYLTLWSYISWTTPVKYTRTSSFHQTGLG